MLAARGRKARGAASRSRGRLEITLEQVQFTSDCLRVEFPGIQACAAEMRRQLAACLTPAEDGSVSLTVKLPGTEALNRLTDSLAAFIPTAGSKARP